MYGEPGEERSASGDEWIPSVMYFKFQRFGAVYGYDQH